MSHPYITTEEQFRRGPVPFVPCTTSLLGGIAMGFVAGVLFVITALEIILNSPS